MTANPTVTRRNFLLGAALCATMLSGCSQGDGDQAAVEDEPAAAPAAGGNVLVAYYSAQGHTAAVAQTIADELGADLFKVTPTEPYSDDDLDWKGCLDSNAPKAIRLQGGKTHKVNFTLKEGSVVRTLVFPCINTMNGNFVYKPEIHVCLTATPFRQTRS